MDNFINRLGLHAFLLVVLILVIRAYNYFWKSFWQRKILLFHQTGDRSLKPGAEYRPGYVQRAAELAPNL